MKGISSKVAVIEALLAGNVVGLPTESSFALAARIDCETALQTILELKKDRRQPIGIIARNTQHYQRFIQHSEAGDVTDVGTHQNNLIQTYWPGPLSIIFNASAQLSNIITAGTGSVAIRVPDHEFLQTILANVPVPLTATSANPSGRSPACTTEQFSAYFPDTLFYDQISSTPGGLPSTLVDPRGEKIKILRPGALKIEILD